MGHLKPLKKGSLIGIAAPSGPFSKKNFLRGVDRLKKTGFRVTYRNDIFSKKDYLAGSDERRLKELKALLLNPKIEATLFARGGFGCTPLLPFLPRGKIPPKIVAGFSDLTVILNYLWRNFKLPSLYSPMVTTGLNRPLSRQRILSSLTDPNFFKKQRLIARSTIRGGRARGRLMGGCLHLIAATLGTPYEFDTRGVILFLEDTNEETYQIDRMLTQMIQAGKFKGVKGVVLGSFDKNGVYFPKKVRDLFARRLKNFRFPILWGAHFGHCPDPKIVPFGGIGRIHKNELIIEKGLFG